MSRNIWIGIVAVIVLAAGAWWYFTQLGTSVTPTTTSTTEQTTQQGTQATTNTQISNQTSVHTSQTQSYASVLAKLLDRPLSATRADCNYGGAYACNSSMVTYNGSFVSDADASSFKVIDLTPNIGLDNSHVYLGSQIIQGADSATFIWVSQSVGTMAIDKNHVYFIKDTYVPGTQPEEAWVKPIPNSDPYTLTFDGPGIKFHDKNQTYEVSEQRTGCGGDSAGCVTSEQFKVNGVIFQ